MVSVHGGGTSNDASRPEAGESVETFAWRDLRFHVITPGPLTTEQMQFLSRSVRKIDRVGQFAELVAMVTHSHVRIRTERPSVDVRFEVSRLGTPSSR